MAYEFPLDHHALFEERYPQFLNLGIPREALDHVRAAITSMWADEPGGWTYEWSRVAAQYAERGEHYPASLAYGAAKFPVVANEARREALRRQVEEYVKAAPAFGVCFERRLLELPYRGRTTRVPVHLLSGDGLYANAPVLLFSGGLDTWKMDLHPLAVAFARGSGVTTLAFDQPGTGESEVPLDGFADEVIRGLVAVGRTIGDGRVAHFGFSFGGNFAALSGLSGAVDAAIDVGGPVDASFEPENFHRLMYGMADIAGNAYGFSSHPSVEQILEASRGLVRRAWLDQRRNAPMLVINGADDVHVPAADTRVFEGRPSTEVHLVPNSGHCATSKLPELVPLMVVWLRAHLVASSKPIVASNA
jgi:esterase FrsA